MLGKQTCSFLENILVLITFGSLLFISLLIDIKGVVKSVGFAWSGGVVRFRFLEIGRFIS